MVVVRARVRVGVRVRIRETLFMLEDVMEKKRIGDNKVVEVCKRGGSRLGKRMKMDARDASDTLRSFKLTKI